MAMGPGRPSQKSLSNRKRLSSDAAIIIALIKKGPQDKQQLLLSSGVKDREFYRSISLLQEKNYVYSRDGKYCLWFFKPLEPQIEAALATLTAGNHFTTLSEVANELAVNWQEIAKLTLKVAKKHGYMITGTGSQTMFIAQPKDP